MSERPFMQLYVSDYFGDTRHLSCEQHGAYLLLLLTMWNANGALPDDDVQLARIACLSVKKWKATRPVIIAFFDVAGGVISHNRMTKELQKSASQSQSRADAGARGGAATALKTKSVIPAIAPANGAAGLQHLPEPYRKRGNSPLKKGAASPQERVRLHSDDPLFRMIAETRRAAGGMSPSTDRDGCWTFPAGEVEAARASLASVPA